jgi:LacI family gluconate utilization system Gnt-I transcriptional repressor
MPSARSRSPASRSAAPRVKDSRAVTIHDVAALANVSSMTVSRALKTPERVSADALQKVRDAVAKTGYVPNALAGGLRSSRTRLVAALVPALKTHIYDAMIQALTDALAASGYSLLLGQTGHSPDREEELLRATLARRPDGIVITGVTHSRGSRQLLLGAGIPIVETHDWTSAPIDMLVGFSHERMGADVCQFLVRKGRKRLALITADSPRALQRAEGFVAAAARLRLRAPLVEVLPAPTGDHAAGRAALARLLAASKTIDGVYCASDMVALGVLTEARVRGIAVPEALAVVGSGDLDFAASISPSLTTVRVDLVRIGSLAARYVVDRIEGRDVAEPSVNVGHDIVERDSA